MHKLTTCMSDVYCNRNIQEINNKKMKCASTIDCNRYNVCFLGAKGEKLVTKLITHI